MGRAERTKCPGCGAYLTLALPPGGKGKRTFQCFDCDGPDPLKTDKVTRWLKSELQPRGSSSLDRAPLYGRWSVLNTGDLRLRRRHVSKVPLSNIARRRRPLRRFETSGEVRWPALGAGRFPAFPENISAVPSIDRERKSASRL